MGLGLLGGSSVVDPVLLRHSSRELGISLYHTMTS